MDFKQKKDGSCTLNFNDKEIDIIKTKKQIHFTPEALRHFGNVLMKIVIDFNQNFKKTSLVSIIFKTLGFTYLNPHVYSDTVFFLGNFSKSFLLNDKIIFGIGASVASTLFFFFAIFIF